MGLEGALVPYVAIQVSTWSIPGELEALCTFLPFHLLPETLHQIQLEPIIDTDLARIGCSSKFIVVKMKTLTPKCSDALVVRKKQGKSSRVGQCHDLG